MSKDLNILRRNVDNLERSAHYDENGCQALIFYQLKRCINPEVYKENKNLESIIDYYTEQTNYATDDPIQPGIKLLKKLREIINNKNYKEVKDRINSENSAFSMFDCLVGDLNKAKENGTYFSEKVCDSHNQTTLNTAKLSEILLNDLNGKETYTRDDAVVLKKQFLDHLKDPFLQKSKGMSK